MSIGINLREEGYIYDDDFDYESSKEPLNYREVEGNLITLAKEGAFDVIAHGCNCFCTMGAGIAPIMAREFGADKFKKEREKHRGDINKLGTIDYNWHWIGYDDRRHTWKGFIVVNAYTQYGFGRNHAGGKAIPLDYEALALCMRKINHRFKGKHIGLPQIGCGLAGGIWDQFQLTDDQLREADFNLNDFKDVKTIIQQELQDCNVTVVIYTGL